LGKEREEEETVTKRASPIRHDVGGHFRGGKFIETFERGKGERKKKRTPAKKKRAKPKKIKSKKGLFYTITLSGQGKSETYNGAGSPVSSIRQVVNKLQRPIVPTRAVLRRVKS